MRKTVLDRVGSPCYPTPWVLLALLSACAPSSPSEPPLADTNTNASTSEEPAGAPESDTDGKHVLLTLHMTPSDLEVLSARTVDGPLPTLRGAQRDGWRVDVEDATGKVEFSAPLPAANVLRGEFASNGGQIDAVHLRTEDAVFAVRVPLSTAATQLRLMGEVSTLDPDNVRAKGRRTDDVVELGTVAYPEVAR